MKRITPIFPALFLMGSVMVGAAIAQSSGAHYQKNSVKASIGNNGNLTLSWVEAGLGNEDVSYTLQANLLAVYFCRSNSGSFPNAANKTTSQSPVSAAGTFHAENGKVTASLTLTVPAAPSSAPPTCGNGQTLALQSVTWRDLVLSDITYSDTFSFGQQTFARTFFPAP